jgi:L-amino acid N-acyltransferase YncA
MIELRKVRRTDYEFVYKLIKDFLDSELSVTFLELPKFPVFCKTYFKGKKFYIILYNKKRCGTVNIVESEVGYMLAPEFRGKGIAVNAVKKLMEMHPKKRFFATINNENERSINLIKKLGFRPKGTIFEKIVDEKE